MWVEFERLVRAHSPSSPQHLKVLECLLECKRPSGEEGRTAPPRSAGEEGRTAGGSAADIKREEGVESTDS